MSEHIALVFLFFAYTAVFVIIFLFVGRAHRRTRQLEDEIKRLQESLRTDGEDGDVP